MTTLEEALEEFKKIPNLKFRMQNGFRGEGPFTVTLELRLRGGFKKEGIRYTREVEIEVDDKNPTVAIIKAYEKLIQYFSETKVDIKGESYGREGTST